MFRAVDSEYFSRSTTPECKQELNSSDAQLSEDRRTEKRINPEITFKMIFKDVLMRMFIWIAFVLTTYGAIHNSSSTISKHPPPVRFFKLHSNVVDWYKGELGDALQVINHADISFVMYYAPWDAECQYVKKEFEKTANLLSDRVHFSAINCWNPGSECRQQHNKMPAWPILIAYTVTSRGILYKGPRDAQSMIQFLEFIMRPLRRISDSEDLVHLLSYCDSVAVGYTPLSSTSQHYNVWYDTALKTREFDVFGEICFAVVTSEALIAELGIDVVPTARFMLWNETKEYQGDDQKWNTSLLSNWVLESFYVPADRVMPGWKKSYTFEKYNDGNPMLILFTPLNPLYKQVPNYALFREIAMEYKNCDKNSHENQYWISELIKLQQVQRMLYQQRNPKKFCLDHRKRRAQIKLKHKSIVSKHKYPWHNMTQKHNKQDIFEYLLKRGLELSNIESGGDGVPTMLWDDCSLKPLPANKNFYSYYDYCLYPDDDLDERQDLGSIESLLPHDGDELSANNLIDDHVKHFCKISDFAYTIQPPVNPAKDNMNITTIKGLACSKNRTFHMLVIDSIVNYHFAQSLGIDIRKVKDKTAVVILDSKHESQYVLKEEYSAKSLRDFIYNFTNNELRRTLRSQITDTSFTHKIEVNNSTDKNTSSILTFKQLTTRTFKRFINTVGMMSIVVICSGSCPGSVLLIVVNAGRAISRAGAHVQLGRIDATQHDLPWEYVPHSYPTIYVIANHRGRQQECLTPPVGERLSSSSILALALKAMGPPDDLKLRLEICRWEKTTVDKKKCLRDIREHITSVINKNLQYWRRSDNVRLQGAFLKRLIHLHSVSVRLSLLSIDDLLKAKLSDLMHCINALSKEWSVGVVISNGNAIS